MTKTVFDIDVPNALGNNIKLSEYKGRNAYLIVNVACQCGLTNSNYRDLQLLYDVCNVVL